MDYKVILTRDAEGNWLASVPALVGCHTWDTTREGALANAREAAQGYVDSLKDAGETPPSDVEILWVEVEKRDQPA